MWLDNTKVCLITHKSYHKYFMKYNRIYISQVNRVSEMISSTGTYKHTINLTRSFTIYILYIFL